MGEDDGDDEDTLEMGMASGMEVMGVACEAEGVA